MPTEEEKAGERKKTVLAQIIVAVAVALLAGGTAPWWWKEIAGGKGNRADLAGPSNFPPPVGPPAPGGVGPDTPPVEPPADFPGGSRPVYSAEFAAWPRPNTAAGSIGLGFGNSYVMRPAGNTSIGPGHMMQMPRLNEDFVVDVRFRIVERNPSSSLSIELAGGGPDANSVAVYFDVWEQGNVTYSIETRRIRAGSLPVPHAIREQSIAQREQLRPELKLHDWSNDSKLTLKRDGGEMQFFVNDHIVRAFPVPVFPVELIGVGAAFRSAIEVTLIEARTRI